MNSRAVSCFVLLLWAAMAPQRAWAEQLQRVKPEADRSPAGAFWSLLYPGGGQFYAGDPVRGYVYLGVGLAGGLVGFGVMRAQLPGTVPATAEETALGVLVGYGALLAIEAASTVDAIFEIVGKSQSASLDKEAAAAPVAVLPPPRPSVVPARLATIPQGASNSPPLQAAAPVPPATATPTPTEVPSPLPLALDSDSAHVVAAYQLADRGEFIQALAALERIQAPAFGPKIAALRRQWGPAAAAELLAKAEGLASQGKGIQALAVLNSVLKLPSSREVHSRALALRKRLLAKGVR
ncbi:MAG: hypothetical protein KGR26_11175 [Cyanobacteria bacterium REEB65]|nr:hypothetical protein [Cyanobacteria bacterium REEB65]